MTEVVVVIPFRDRGRDPLRYANFSRVLNHWVEVQCAYPWKIAVRDDGRTGEARFNRSAAYNRAVADYPNAEVFVFTEADMLVRPKQIAEAVNRAKRHQGLVVGFSHYHYLGPKDSQGVREGRLMPHEVTPEIVRINSIGAITVVSMESVMAVGGFDEDFDGNGYDDDAIKRAFEICCGPTTNVVGPGWHLYHDPAWPGRNGATLTQGDIDATEANRRRYGQYLRATRPEQIRELTTGNSIWRS